MSKNRNNSKKEDNKMEQEKDINQESNKEKEPEKVSGDVVDENGKPIGGSFRERIERTPKWLKRLALIGMGTLIGVAGMILFGSRGNDYDHDYQDDDYEPDDDSDDYESDDSDAGEDDCVSED